MKIGLNFFPVRPEYLLPAARRADELGYDSIWMGEHVVLPTKIASPYPYAADAGPPLTTTPLFDPFITLTYVAAQTKKIEVGTSVYLIPLRNPVQAAKFAATLDRLSGGRFVFGLGVGWLKEEYDTIEAPWDHRGARLDEAIGIMRRLWTETTVAHEGPYYSFAEVGFEPKPARAPIPIWIGGETPAALKRAARLGDGWLGTAHTPESAAGRVKQLRELRGDDDRPFEVLVSPLWVPSLDEVRHYQDAGVHRLMLSARMLSAGQKTVAAMLDGLNRFAETVVDRVKD